MINMQKYPMTENGAKQLALELQHLKSVVRPSVIAAISEARSHGDLSENAEYDAAKEKQSFTEGRIAEIENKLSHAQIINPQQMGIDGKVIFGASVIIMDLENDTEINYQIVGDDEADVRLGKISVNSPVARGLIGKQAGDVIEINVPSGIKEYEIIDVMY
jgi:transcription elongation factor GreA